MKKNMNKNQITDNTFTKLTLSLSTDSFKIVEDQILQWCETSEVKDKILFRYIFAINEALEAIINLAKILKIQGMIDIEIEPYLKHITTHITFPKEIPLDPAFDHKDDILDQFPELKIAPDIFWHHVILQWVDKASWSKSSGNKVTVSLSQYARSEVNRTGELYFLNMKPSLSKGLKFEYIDNDVIVARSNEHESAVKLNSKSIFILKLIDGTTDVRDIYYSFVKKFGFIAPGIVGQLIEELEERKLIYINSKPLNNKKENKFQIFLKNFLKFRYSIPKADTFVELLNRKIGRFWSQGALYIYFAFIIISIIAFGRFIPEIKEMVNNYFQENMLFDKKIIIAYYLGLSFYIIIHEFSHAIVCKRYGGRVSEVGILLFYANLCFFVDTTDSWMFKNKWHRIMVSLAGPLSTFILALVFGWGWILSMHFGNHNISPMFGSIFILGIMNVFINLLPFLKLDGYFILVDLINMPNLSKNSLKYFTSLYSRKNSDKVSKKDSLIFVIYSILTIFSIILLFILLLSFIYKILNNYNGILDWVIGSLLVLLFFKTMIDAGLNWYKNKFLVPIDLKINR